MTVAILDQIRQRAAAAPRRIVFTRPGSGKVLAAVAALRRNGIAQPVLVAAREEIERSARKQGVSLSRVEVIEPDAAGIRRYVDAAVSRWRSAGVGESEAIERLFDPDEFAVAMVLARDADGVVSFPEANRDGWRSPAVSAAGLRTGLSAFSECFLVVPAASETVIVVNPASGEPSALQLAQIGLEASATARGLVGCDPRLAFLTSTIGASLGPRDRYRSAADRLNDRVRDAAETLRVRDESIVVDSAPKIGFEALGAGPNVLVLTGHEAGNLGDRLSEAFDAPRVVGPITMGPAVPVNVVSARSTVEDIVDLTAVTVLSAGTLG